MKLKQAILGTMDRDTLKAVVDDLARKIGVIHNDINNCAQNGRRPFKNKG